MTVDNLRARKRELLARRKYELDLQAKGEGDELALFMVNEELLTVNAQLRALSPGHRVGGRGSRTGGKAWEMDLMQFKAWMQEDTALDGGETRIGMKQAAVQGLEGLSRRQREVLERHLEGMPSKEIAKVLGVQSSTVSHTLARAKKNVRMEVERAAVEKKLLQGERAVDLSDPMARQAVVLAMTTKQTVYFYLYFSEWLSMREVGELLGVSHSTIVRTLARALRNIGKLLGDQPAILRNPEFLNELAYQTFCQMLEHPELLPRTAPRPAAYVPASKKRPDKPQAKPAEASCRQLVRVCGRPGRKKPPGKLLAALLERKAAAAQWLTAVFRMVRDRLKTKKGGRHE